MNENPSSFREPVPSEPYLDSNNNSATMPLVVYLLNLASLFVGFTSIIGVIIAYIYKGQGPVWLNEHYRYQIRTFWIGFLYSVIATILLFVFIGWILFILIVIWLIIRSIKGIQALQNRRAPSNVDSWLF